MRNPVCVGPISYAGHDALQRDIANVKAAVDAARSAGYEVAAFLPVVAPASVAYKRQDVYYASEEEYVFAVAEALREEYRAIVDAGLMLQVDDAHLPMMYDNIVDPGTPDDFRRVGAAADRRPQPRPRGHPPRPQPLSHLLGQLQFPARRRRAVPRDRRPRAVGQRRRLRDRDGQPAPRARVARLARTLSLPDDSVLIPGVIAHTTNVVEHPELVAERLVRLAELVGRERVIGGTDCGFAQGPYVRRVHPTIMWAKLAALVEGARLASERLWA